MSEFRDGKVARHLAEEIQKEAAGLKITLMEVCGTHTMAIARFGIRQILPENITLISGPGCPVCVTSNQTVDTAVALSKNPEIIVTTFGDMMRNPADVSWKGNY